MSSITRYWEENGRTYHSYGTASVELAGGALGRGLILAQA